MIEILAKKLQEAEQKNDEYEETIQQAKEEKESLRQEMAKLKSPQINMDMLGTITS